jgi:nitrite reductase/ring-hydroxylating ferredoxin subunit
MSSANRQHDPKVATARRPFLARFLAAILSAIAVCLPFAAGAGLVLDPLCRRRQRPADGEAGDGNERFIRVGPLERLPADGVPRLFVLSASRRDAWTRIANERIGAAYLSRHDSGDGPQVTAFAAACPHLGCLVNYDDAAAQFACPCHQAAFSADGSRLSGPSLRGLDPLDVELRPNEAGGTSIFVAFQRFRPGSEERTPIA